MKGALFAVFIVAVVFSGAPLAFMAVGALFAAGLYFWR